MILPDELLDNFKYAITEEDIPMLEEAFRAGMLAAADFVSAPRIGMQFGTFYGVDAHNRKLAEKIREATK